MFCASTVGVVTVQNSAAPAGSTWVEGDSLRWSDGSNEYLIRGRQQGIAIGDGSDGSLTVSSSGEVVNEYTYVTRNESAGSSTIKVGDSSQLSPEDEILIIQMQEGFSGTGQAGRYEFRQIESTSTGELSLSSPLQKSYHSGKFADSQDQEGISTQVIRVPEYTDVTVDGGDITASEWNGRTGGIAAFRVQGDLETINGGSIDVSQKGFRGGTCGACGDDWDGGRGEGINGWRYGGGQKDYPDEVSLNNVNGGGGNHVDNNDGGDPGAGGGYGTTGETVSDSESQYNSEGGEELGISTFPKMFLGGGGGAGADNDNYVPEPIGGRGGGIAYVAADSMTNINIYSRGEAGTGDGNCCGGASGGGAGGTIYLSSHTMQISNINAKGGDWKGNSATGERGGEGGDGRIRLDSKSISGLSQTSPSVDYQENIEPTGSAGSWWIEGASIHWVDQNKQERELKLESVGSKPSDASTGNTWIGNSGNIRYTGEGNNERRTSPPEDCSEVVGESGNYKIDPDGVGGISPFTVYCEMNPDVSNDGSSLGSSGGPVKDRYTFKYIKSGQSTSQVTDSNSCRQRDMILFQPRGPDEYDVGRNYVIDDLGFSPGNWDDYGGGLGPLGIHYNFNADDRGGIGNFDAEIERDVVSEHYRKDSESLGTSNLYGEGTKGWETVISQKFWAEDTNQDESEPNGDYKADAWMGYDWDGSGYVTNYNDNDYSYAYDQYLCMMPKYPENCDEISGSTGIYSIDPDGPGGSAPFKVYCDMETDGGGWTLVYQTVSGDQDTNMTNKDLWDGSTNPSDIGQPSLRDIKEVERGEDYFSRAWGTDSSEGVEVTDLMYKVAHEDSYSGPFYESSNVWGHYYNNMVDYSDPESWYSSRGWGGSFTEYERSSFNSNVGVVGDRTTTRESSMESNNNGEVDPANSVFYWGMMGRSSTDDSRGCGRYMAYVVGQDPDDTNREHHGQPVDDAGSIQATDDDDIQWDAAGNNECTEFSENGEGRYGFEEPPSAYSIQVWVR